MKRIIIGCLILLSACEPYKPEYVDKNGKEYIFTSHCVKSHNETDYDYHYGYNMIKGGFDWHYGMDTKTICDSSVIDTIEINKDKHYYTKK